MIGAETEAVPHRSKDFESDTWIRGLKLTSGVSCVGDSFITFQGFVFVSVKWEL